MGIIESIVGGTLSLVNTYQQGRSFFNVEDFEGKSVAAFLAKSAEEVLRDKAEGKPIGAEIVSKGINALVDYKVTTGIYEHLTSGDSPMNPVLASIISKGAGLIASSIAGKLAGGIADKLFGANDTTADEADNRLRSNGRYNGMGQEPSMIARFEELLGAGHNVNGASAPLGGSYGRQNTTALG